MTVLGDFTIGLFVAGLVAALLSSALGIVCWALIAPMWWTKFRSFVTELNEQVALRDFLVAVVVWIGIAALFSHIGGGKNFFVPHDGYFGTAAQINATLLVAAAVVAIAGVPTAWQGTARGERAWILAGLTVAVIGLVAGVAGSTIANEKSSTLFVLSISPIAPTVFVIFAGALQQVGDKH